MLGLLSLLQVALLHICSGAAESGVRVTSLDVPYHVARGDNVSLTCLWDLNSYDLYSVKWYRDDREFYRFIPSEKTKGTHNLPGINVDEQKSDGNVVVLLNVGLNTGGHYKCEVISFPDFHTADKSKEMLVVGGAGPTQHPLTLALLALVMTVSLAQTAVMDSLDGIFR